MYSLCILLLVTSSLAESFDDDKTKRSSSDLELFEGDMLLTKEQIQAAVNGQNPSNVGGARGLSSTYMKWPRGIVYYTIDTRRPIKRAVIHGAIREWEEKTCIKFKPKTMSYQKDYIEFFVGSGCWSSVGHIGGKQQISLGFGCITHGTAVHEIGHALGFFHEQSRPDRDKYVEILWDNIPKDKHSQFTKYSSIHSLNSPYDYGSIMHYGKHEFAKWPWMVSIRPKQSGVKIGNRRRLSPLDVEQMNMYYNCNKK